MNADQSATETSSGSPPFDPTQPAIPISYPIITLEDLESRSYFDSFHYSFNKSSVALQSNGGLLPERPRMLVCHDMAGGYTNDDKWVQGGANEEAYAIWHWYLIDMYAERLTELAIALGFDGWLLNMEVNLDVGQIPILKEFVRHLTQTMHSLVPGALVIWYDSITVNGDLNWQNQLNDSNKPFFDICDGIFINYSWLEDYPKQSSTVAGNRKFDVYMGIDVFGRNTYGGGQWTAALVLRWIREGRNHLSIGCVDVLRLALSQCFFRCWFPFEYLHLEVGTPYKLKGLGNLWLGYSSSFAGENIGICQKEEMAMEVCDDERSFMVQGFVDNGEGQTNVALDVIKKDDVSAAIFAPGWVYETKQPPNFQTAQNRWWGLVEKSWGILQHYPNALPFYSSFDQALPSHDLYLCYFLLFSLFFGHGYHISFDGVKVSDAPWNNVSCQSFQPFLEFSGDPTQDTVQAFVDFKEASYNGGGNITFRGTLEGTAYFTTRLFQAELLLGNLPVHFIYSVKSDGSSLVGLALDFASATKEKLSVLLASRGNALLTMNQFSCKFSNVIMPHRVTKLETVPGWIIQESSINMNGYLLTGIHAVCYKSKPESRSLHQDNSLAQAPTDYYAVLGHIRVETSQENLDYYAVLGHIRVETSQENLDFPPPASWLVEDQYVKWTSASEGSKTLSVKITWKLKSGIASPFTSYNLYLEKEANKTDDKPGGLLEITQEYLGVARVETFYVSDLVVPSGTSSLKFKIQVCGLDGTCQKLDDSPFLWLPVDTQ
ncbi:hypothetical protein RJ639_003194 [Escallonia herrerae]|uniref:mannosyl-glycoprotein endo-beta-N-acetylglucosaminidase n=1 Tax=Escallonia herrerae TaxID=1293975 RepID=A0AA88W450_9ASTE|nr:hypothetical protein RJ639_003194 [Escallonia herrerae]